jgi:[glutamine synthetase] adenylyltransferase / [glutamine synthetase]-adenylyl-L-tyrosine phosphorylase
MEPAARFWNDLAPDHQAMWQDNRKFLESVAGGSPYLRALMLRDPQFLADLLSHGPEGTLNSLCAGLHAAQTLSAQAEIMTALRHAKAKASLLIALADLGEVWSVDEVTAALTRFADAMLGAAVNWLLLDATRAGKFRCVDENDPSRHCGYVVLAMGKHGAGELNYSSDIDLIILYDPETAPMAEGVEPATFFVRLTKRLVTILQDMTEDG